MYKGGNMILVFNLKMPGVGSWDGKWSGSKNNYYKVVNCGRGKESNIKAKEILDKERFDYNFGDGWMARIWVTEADAKGAARVRKISSGFCGYDWMVDSIMGNLKISV